MRASTRRCVLAGLMALPGAGAAVADRIGFQAFFDASNGIFPSAPYVAVGPDHIVVTSNNGIRFFTKAGQMTYDNTFSGTNGFFPGGGTPFNPQVIFDPHARRFIVAGYYTYAFDDLITVAISDDEDPNGDWNRHTIDVDRVNGITLWDGDRITVGVDQKVIYVHNDFLFASNPQDPFSHGFIFSVDKQALMQGLPPDVVAVEPFDFPLALVPARTYDAGVPAQYFVTPFGTFGSEDKIRLFALRDPLGEPQVTTLELEVPPYDFVTQGDRIPHPGGGQGLTATDTRMRRAVYRDGSLWTAHHVIDPPTGRHVARWYQIRMHGWPESGPGPELVQSGEIDLGPGIHTFLPDIAPDAHGNAVIVFARSAAALQPALMRAVHDAGGAPGNVTEIELLRENEVPLESHIFAASAAADLDPGDAVQGWVGGAYWVRNQFMGRQPAMWVNAVGLPVGLPGDLDCDGRVDFGDINPFVLALADPAGYQTAFPDCEIENGDINADGKVDFGDINPFVNLLTQP